MKAVMVMFDSLNRHMLPPYGCEWIKAPNFSRLAERAVTFETSYVCSMPCMPARRDLHTGRPNFLHRSWGPIEPYDDSVPEILKNNGVYTHLATDHYHYFEDGGANYHCRYNTWEFFRGQEGDPWIGQVANPSFEGRGGRNASSEPMNRQDVVNRQFIQTEKDFPQPQTFAAGMEFIRRNWQADSWFVQIEGFDPHEPFFAPQKYQDLYPHGYKGPLVDWPGYMPSNDESPEMLEHMRLQYAALLSMCDHSLGKIIDQFDELGLWDDTMLIVWTDHGFLLGEHDWWGKMRMPFYEHIAHTPFFVWDPRFGKKGERRKALVQPSIDLGPTLLDFFGKSATADMTGRSLAPVIERDTPIHESGIFGVHGGQVNVTDGRYVYMRAPDPAAALFNYTLIPGNMRDRWGSPMFGRAELYPGFSFTKNAPLLKVPASDGKRNTWFSDDIFRDLLWDLQADPKQERPIRDEAIERRMIQLMTNQLKLANAPTELYQRLRLS